MALESFSSQTDDFVQPFLIDRSPIRGRLVRLGPAVDTILSRHDYPYPVSVFLAELLVVAAMLSSNLKSKGILTLQAKGEGPVKFVVVDATHGGGLRGYAELAEDAANTLAPLARRKKPALLSELFGKGYLAITLDTGIKGARYQGIVELAPTTLADAIRHYFTQSQQMDMTLTLVAEQSGTGKKKRWHAAGLMIERVPEEGGTAASSTAQSKKGASRSGVTRATSETAADKQEQWQRNRLLMESATHGEILGADLSSWDLLRRLFHEEGVWVYPPHSLQETCRCSRPRIRNILRSLPSAELRELVEDGAVTVTCQFCNGAERFTLKELQAPRKKAR